MKLFENGVGRPSNEIKKKRKIFIASIISLVVFAFLGVFILIKNNINNLQANSSSYAVSVEKINYTTVKLKVKQPKDGYVFIYATHYSANDPVSDSVSSVMTKVSANKQKDITVNYLASGRDYNFLIKYEDDKYNELYKKTISVKTPVKRPFVGSVKKSNNSVSLTNINFNAPTSKKPGETGYSITMPDKVIVYRSEKKDTGFKQVGEVSKVSNSGWDLDMSFNCVYVYTDNNLKSGTTYYYKVRGYYESDMHKKSYYGPYSTTYRVKTKGKKQTTKNTTKNTTKKTTKVTTNKQNSYNITFGMHSSCKDVMTLNNKAVTYNGSSFKMPSVNATYKNKNYEFKYWIIQRTNDGRYRVHNKNTGKYVWYRASKDSAIKWSYVTFKPGETISAYNAPLRLYAVCGKKASQTNSGTNSSSVPSNKIRITYLKNNSAATGSMQSKDFDRSGLIVIDPNLFRLNGYTFNGWKAYRTTNGVKKYFVKEKGWTGSSSSALLIKNSDAINKNYSISSYTGGGSTIYLEAQWRKK